MTQLIPAGTRNFTFNIPVDERALLGRLSVKYNAKSVGDFAKHLTLLGLQSLDPEAAKEVIKIRDRYYGKPQTPLRKP